MIMDVMQTSIMCLIRLSYAFFSMVPIFSPSTFAKGGLLLPTQVTDAALSEKFAASSMPVTTKKEKN